MNKIFFLVFIVCSNLLYGQQAINNLQWLNGEQEITELSVHQGLTLYAQTENINDNEMVKISIWEKGEQIDYAIGEYISRVTNDEIFFHWRLNFEDSELRNKLYEDGYTVRYYFVVQHGGIKSHESTLLDVGSWIHTKVMYEGDRDALKNKKYTLVVPDGSRITGWTDAEGYVRQDFLKIWGDYYFYMNDETDEDEEHKVEPPYNEPQNPIYYVVKENDSLWKIASYDFIYGNPYFWKTIYEANKHNLLDDKNPHLIEVGQTLLIPPHDGVARTGTR